MIGTVDLIHNGLTYRFHVIDNNYPLLTDGVIARGIIEWERRGDYVHSMSMPLATASQREGGGGDSNHIHRLPQTQSEEYIYVPCKEPHIVRSPQHPPEPFKAQFSPYDDGDGSRLHANQFPQNRFQSDRDEQGTYNQPLMCHPYYPQRMDQNMKQQRFYNLSSISQNCSQIRYDYKYAITSQDQGCPKTCPNHLDLRHGRRSHDNRLALTETSGPHHQ